VNWMTAGRGIVHSERSPDDLRAAGHRVHGIQSWVALPKSSEQTAPDFKHYPVASLPTVTAQNVRLRVIAGSAFGETSPVKVQTGILYVDAALEAGATLTLSAEHQERAVYAVDTAITIDGAELPVMQMAVLNPGVAVTIAAAAPGRVMILGGEPLDAPRLIWWNFVASDEALLEAAKADWASAAQDNWQGRFQMPPDENEFIPLPEN
jgi:redox-sensitive bicupin YhaK (pirin superfamily)